MEEYQEGLTYSEEVKDAVRYGYQYRMKVEEHESKGVYFCLDDASEILFWIANMVIGGLSWDLLKSGVKKLYESLKRQGIKIDEETHDVLMNEDCLRVFFVYIKEFNEHKLSVDKRQRNFIREEIIANIVGEETEKIFNKKNRLPSIQEYMKIRRKAVKRADKLLK